MSDILQQLLLLLVPFVVGVLSKYAWDGFERLPLLLDQIPALVKPVAVAVVAWGIGLLAQWLQVQLPGDLHLWTADTVHTLIAAVVAYVIHEIQKRTSAATSPAGTSPSFSASYRRTDDHAM